jgi:ribose transport system substrate-binding protein
MKRILCILIGVSLVLIMAAGCAPKVEVPPTTEATTTAPSTEATTEAPTTEAAVGQEDTPKGEGVVYYMAPMLSDEFQAGANLMSRNIGSELGYEVKSLNANNDVTKQINQMDDAVGMKPKAIILNAVDVSALVGSADKARAEGIPILVFDRFITETTIDFSSVVGTVKIGQIAGKECARLLKEKYGEEKGVVLEIMGDLGDNYTIMIDKGFKEVMAAYPNVEIITKDTPQWEPSTMASTVDDQITARKDIDILFNHADDRTAAIIPVFESHGYKQGDIIWISTDGTPTGLKSIRDGWVLETVQEPMVAMAHGLWAFMDEVLAKEEIKTGKYTIEGLETELITEKWGPTLYFPGDVISKENVDDPNLWGNVKVEVEK